MSKAEQIYEKLAKVHTGQAGGVITGSAVGGIVGSNLGKALEEAVKTTTKSGKLPKGSKALLALTGMYAGGQAFGQAGKLLDNIINSPRM